MHRECFVRMARVDAKREVKYILQEFWSWVTWSEHVLPCLSH